MLAGDKPLAMFSDVVTANSAWPDDLFAPYVACGTLVKKEFFTNTPDGHHQVRTVFFALPDQVWRIEEAYLLSCKQFRFWCEEASETCARLGRLLGYREEDIRAFELWSAQLRATAPLIAP